MDLKVRFKLLIISVFVSLYLNLVLLTVYAIESIKKNNGKEFGVMSAKLGVMFVQKKNAVRIQR